MNKKYLIFGIIIVVIAGAIIFVNYSQKDLQKSEIGNVVSNGVLSVIVNSVSFNTTYQIESNDSGQVNSYILQSKPNYKFVIVDMAMKNIGNDLYILDLLFFNLSDENGFNYSEDGQILSLQPTPPLTVLQTGMTKMAKIIYQIPENSIAKELKYSDYKGNKIVIRLV